MNLWHYLRIIVSYNYKSKVLKFIYYFLISRYRNIINLYNKYPSIKTLLDKLAIYFDYFAS